MSVREPADSRVKTTAALVFTAQTEFNQILQPLCVGVNCRLICLTGNIAPCNGLFFHLPSVCPAHAPAKSSTETWLHKHVRESVL